MNAAQPSGSHSERNPSSTESPHLRQIWITPDQPGGDPAYADMDTNALKKQNALTHFASGDGRDGSQKMRQNAEIYIGQIKEGRSISHEPLQLLAKSDAEFLLFLLA